MKQSVVIEILEKEERRMFEKEMPWEAIKNVLGDHQH